MNHTFKPSRARHLRPIKTVLVWLGLGLLALASAFSAGLWVRSYWYADNVSHVRPQTTYSRSVDYEINSFCGVVWIWRRDWRTVTPRFTDSNPRLIRPALTSYTRAYRPQNRESFFARRHVGRGWGLLGFGLWKHELRPPMPPEIATETTLWNIAFPHWFAVLLFGTWPALFARRRLRLRRRARRGLCLACGYDLRASSARCPECGTALHDAAAQPATVVAVT